jgi:hypothetical protein
MPSRTRIAPTEGFGHVRPSSRSPRRIAAIMNRASSSVPNSARLVAAAVGIIGV